jgi:hypothetical protein
MSDIAQLFEIAEKFLIDGEIAFTQPGKVVLKKEDEAIVQFFVPEYFDKSVAVVDPPDVRVHINLKSRIATLVPQL